MQADARYEYYIEPGLNFYDKWQSKFDVNILGVLVLL